MNSPFANLFSELQERIKTEVPAIRWIDQDVGQLEHYETRPAVSFPCVLIDMDAFTYDLQGALQQSAEGHCKRPKLKQCLKANYLLWRNRLQAATNECLF